MSEASLPIAASDTNVQRGFDEVLALIVASRERAYAAVNTTLIDLYWQVDAYINRKLESSEWGDGVVAELARYLAQTHSGLRGFSRQNFFECGNSMKPTAAMILSHRW